jgi:hypothetical protein
MEKIPKTELYQRGIPLLAFLPMLALLSERTKTAPESSEEWELGSAESAEKPPMAER